MMHSLPLPELVIVFLLALIILGPGPFRQGPRGPFSR